MKVSWDQSYDAKEHGKRRVCTVWVLMSPSIMAPVAESAGSEPEQKTTPPAIMA